MSGFVVLARAGGGAAQAVVHGQPCFAGRRGSYPKHLNLSELQLRTHPLLDQHSASN
jgi:hypothetical protein